MVHGPVSKRRFSRRLVRQTIISAVSVVAAIIVAVVGWQMLQSSQEAMVQTDRQQAEAMVKSQAQTVSAYFNQIAENLNAYAGTDRLRMLFEQGNSDQLAAEAQSAAGQFAGALKLRLLQPRQYDIDTASIPPLSYGSIDILNRAEQSTGAIAAEVLMFGTENQHVVLVARVKNQSDQLIGLAHLSLDVNTLTQSLAGINVGNAYIEIRQSASGTPLVLARVGNASHSSGEFVNASVAGTRWTLAFWPGDAASTSNPDNANSGWMPLFLIVLGVVAAGAAAFVLMKKKDTVAELIQIDKPGISYAGAIQAIMDGAHPGMEKLVSNLPNKTAAASITSGISRGLAGDDITMIMKKENLKLSAEDVIDITGGSSAPPVATTARPPVQKPAPSPDTLPEVIFRKYDIRGIVGKTLTPEIVTKIGQAIGTLAEEMGEKTVIVGRDGRVSGPELVASLIDGLKSAGRDVIDIGVVPTPVLYFATNHLQATSGVMLTGSHNGPEYNGLKIVLGGNTLSEEGITELYQRIKSGRLFAGSGTVSSSEILADYVRRITDDIPVALGRAYKLVVDCGNGVAGVIAPQLYRALGHDVIEMYCELDGNFPNHHPDPSQPENLQELIDRVKSEKADLGFAFDGDGDRLGVVDSAGNVIWPDRQMMIFARDVLSRNQGAPIIFDVKCSSHLGRIIEQSGGKALMWKTGHSLIKSKMKEEQAPLAGEMSGHIFFKERWYGFDDALYAGARLLEILLNSKVKPAEFFAQIPDSISTPELKIDMPESQHQVFMQKLAEKINFDGAKIITIDGFRVEFNDGWGLIRPSNTTPCLVVRFEADTQEALDRIKTGFHELVLSLNPALKLPF